jgi:hypothetical protein
VQALPTATYQRLKGEARACILRDKTVNPTYLPLVQVELCMYDLYREERLAEGGQPATQEVPND